MTASLPVQRDTHAFKWKSFDADVFCVPGRIYAPKQKDNNQIKTKTREKNTLKQNQITQKPLS